MEQEEEKRRKSLTPSPIFVVRKISLRSTPDAAMPAPTVTTLNLSDGSWEAPVWWGLLVCLPEGMSSYESPWSMRRPPDFSHVRVALVTWAEQSMPGWGTRPEASGWPSVQHSG